MEETDTEGRYDLRITQKYTLEKSAFDTPKLTFLTNIHATEGPRVNQGSGLLNKVCDMTVRGLRRV